MRHAGVQTNHGGDQGASRQSVAIVIPTYNRLHTLKRAIASVFEQTHGAWHLWIVDDGSTDGTGAYLNSIRDPRVHVIRHRVNKGAAAARNSGIEASTSEFVAFQDSDDVWRPDLLEAHLDHMAQGVDVSFCAMRMHRDGASYTVPASCPTNGEVDLAVRLLHHNFIGTPATVLRRRCLPNRRPFDEQLPALEDWDLWIRLAQCCRFGFLPRTLVDVSRSPDSLSTDVARILDAEAAILAKYEQRYLEVGRETHHAAHVRLARENLLHGRRREARRALRVARKYGIRGSTLVTWAASCLPTPFYVAATSVRSHLRARR